MRVVIAGLIAASLVAGVADTGHAAKARGKQQRAYAPSYRAPAAVTDAQKWRNLRGYERKEYYEHDSNALPVGSKAWFEQKEREDGCC